jgi:Flp pilus assembly protein TadD
LPANATASAALAITKALQGRPGEAIPYFERAAQQRPNNAAFWKNLGQAYASAGRPDDATEAFRRASQLQHP